MKTRRVRFIFTNVCEEFCCVRRGLFSLQLPCPFWTHVSCRRVSERLDGTIREICVTNFERSIHCIISNSACQKNRHAFSLWRVVVWYVPVRDSSRCLRCCFPRAIGCHRNVLNGITWHISIFCFYWTSFGEPCFYSRCLYICKLVLF